VLLRSFPLALIRDEAFTQALISWGQEKLRAFAPTIFDERLSFLEERQVEDSRSRAEDFVAGTDGQMRAAKKNARDPANVEQPPSLAACGGRSSGVVGKRRRLGRLRMDESVVVKQASEKCLASHDMFENSGSILSSCEKRAAIDGWSN